MLRTTGWSRNNGKGEKSQPWRMLCFAVLDLPLLALFALIAMSWDFQLPLQRHELDSSANTTVERHITKTATNMPATFSDQRENRKPGWVFTEHPSHRPYIAVNGEFLDPNQNAPGRSDTLHGPESTRFFLGIHLRSLAVMKPLLTGSLDSSLSCWARVRRRLR